LLVKLGERGRVSGGPQRRQPPLQTALPEGHVEDDQPHDQHEKGQNQMPALECKSSIPPSGTIIHTAYLPIAPESANSRPF
jgi:hypothetical protein